MAVERKFAIALHGGAGTIPRQLPPEQVTQYRAGLKSALALGTAMLENSTPAIDVVQAVVRKLEDNPLFNAGRGSVLTSAGTVEMDAAIMDGSTGQCGAVACVQTVRNPIGLARAVMHQTPHALLVGPGAESFAEHMGVDRANLDYFRTEQRLEQWRRAQATDSVRSDMDDQLDPGHGTVGCVAMDMRGRLAAATSTGGMTNQMPGRVGDTPLIGAGTWADQKCAVSCTGIGEQFIRHVSAYSVAAIVEHGGKTLSEAGEDVIHRRMNTGDGGLIAVDYNGRITMPYNATGMFRAAADWTGRFDALIWES